MEKLKKILEKLKGDEKDKVFNILKKDENLNTQEKFLIYSYLYPRNLLDKELPSRIKSYRNLYNSPAGFLFPDMGESTLLVEAYRTPQYNRFLRHLYYSFTSLDLVHPVSGNSKEKCCICDKTIHCSDSWIEACKLYTPELEKREYLCFGSNDSGLNICLPCLIQLLNSREILEVFEPGFLNVNRF